MQVKYYVYWLMHPDEDFPRYIGKGQKGRMYTHARETRNGKIPNGGNKHLYHWIKKILDSGKQVKYKKVFRTNDEILAYEIEKKEIDYWREKENCNLLNITAGGVGVGSGKNHYWFGKRHSEETKLKMSEASKGKPKSKEHRRKLSEAHMGKTPSEETRRKLSEAMSGENHPNFGKPLSEETKRKISEAQRGENGHNFGKKRPEHSKKMSGKNNPMVKLRELDIPIIRRLARDSELSYTKIGNIFNVSKHVIYYVVNYKTWKHIKD